MPSPAVHRDPAVWPAGVRAVHTALAENHGALSELRRMEDRYRDRGDAPTTCSGYVDLLSGPRSKTIALGAVAGHQEKIPDLENAWEALRMLPG